jgi:hypothetical protein
MLKRESRINPLTCENETRARFCATAIVIRLRPGEAEALEFARDRGYLPRVARIVYRDNGRESLRILREDAYAWAEDVESADASSFCACLDRDLSALLHAADFRIRDSWAI